MKFTPKTEEQIATENLLPDGTYDFEVQDAEDQVSKAGNDMIKLTLRVYRPDSSYATIFDYLLESVAYKLRHAAEACALLDAYDTGLLNADYFIGKSGRCKIRIQKQDNYPDKNSVSDYVVAASRNGGSTAPQRVPVPADLDDEIPF